MNTQANNDDVVRILRVKPKKLKDKYEVVYLKENQEEKVVLLEDQIVNFRILKDKEYAIDEWETILSSSNTALWFNKAINYLSFKNRTIKEIDDYLKKGELLSSQRKEIIDRLINMRLLNDEAYAIKYLSPLRFRIISSKYLMA